MVDDAPGGCGEAKRGAKIKQAYTQELDDVAAWFENCGIDELTNVQVAQIIRKWIPEKALKPEHKRAAEPIVPIVGHAWPLPK